MKRLIVALMICGCAEGGVAPDAEFDGSPQNNVNNRSDAGQTNNNLARDMPDPCNVCCPGVRQCLDDTTAEVCRSNGNGFDPEPCGDQEACIDGACVVPQVCVPGAISCQDATTALTCRASGTGYTAQTCGAGEACTGGGCAVGAADGTVCATNDVCASGVCHCGTEEACPNIAQGYCASKGCSAGSCGPNGACLDSTKAAFGDPAQDYNHCVVRCQGSCPEPSLNCSQVPSTETDETWVAGCYFPEVFPIGGDCPNDTRCLGGLCRTDYFNQSNFCTRDCAGDGVCPPNSACIEIETDVFNCALLCGDGSVVGQEPCPLDLPTERFDVTCRNIATLGGGAKRVCATP